MKKLTRLFVIMLFLTNTVESFAKCSNRVEIDVNGMVCDFCARAIGKVFSKKEEVLSIDINLDDGKILIEMKEGQSIDHATLEKLIIDSGYDVEKITQACDE